ncbi:MAG: cytochrome c biogenesis protein CcsA, partial [Verrucomicrobia bacterium]|nr:cytochrome c biogenesis protein CcsA [Verrucomicrobiota bacterium]
MNKKFFQKWIPPFLAAAIGLWFVVQLERPREETFAFSKFGGLPVIADGRLKPMDTLARDSLLQIDARQTLNLQPWLGWPKTPKTIPATEWLANVMMRGDTANRWPVFRLDNPDLITFLKLPGKDLARHEDGQHYSWDQIAPSFEALDRENTRVANVEAAHRDAYERAVLKAHDQLVLYASLQNTLQPQDAGDWKTQLADYQAMIPAGVAAVEAREAGKKYDQAVFNAFGNDLQEFDFMRQLGTPLVIPPENPPGQWQRMGAVLMDAAKGRPIPPMVTDYANLGAALRAGDADGFNSAVADLRALFIPAFSHALAHTRAEVFFNRMQPFYNAMIIYVLAGLLAIFSWFNLSETLRRCAVWLIALALFIHTTGLIYRIALQGRPPVTNLYSSAIFIGWGAVILGLVLEKFHKNGIGAVVASGIGFVTLIIAQNLALDGDTMEMMRAVLNNNFWLATHVVVVTLGYASTFVAGFLGLIYVLRGVFTRTLDAGTGRSLARMIYGIVCFATLFSFVGTVLGGIWADQS